MGQPRVNPLLAEARAQRRVLDQLCRALALPLPSDQFGRRRSSSAREAARVRWDRADGASKPPPRPEMPARLQALDPADWRDPPDWEQDRRLVARITRSWWAMTDPMGWWGRTVPGVSGARTVLKCPPGLVRPEPRAPPGGVAGGTGVAPLWRGRSETTGERTWTGPAVWTYWDGRSGDAPTVGWRDRLALAAPRAIRGAYVVARPERRRPGRRDRLFRFVASEWPQGRMCGKRSKRGDWRG